MIVYNIYCNQINIKINRHCTVIEVFLVIPMTCLMSWGLSW